MLHAAALFCHHRLCLALVSDETGKVRGSIEGFDLLNRRVDPA